MVCFILAGWVAALSGCSGPGLTIINESSAWLRFEAAAEVDPRQSLIGGPLSGDESVTFGVPPGARFEQSLEPGGSIFVRQRLGVTLRVRAGPSATGRSRDPLLVTAYTVRLAPPGPYILRFTGEPGTVEIVRVDASGEPLPDDRVRVLPEASMVW